MLDPISASDSGRKGVENICPQSEGTAKLPSPLANAPAPVKTMALRLERRVKLDKTQGGHGGKASNESGENFARSTGGVPRKGERGTDATKEQDRKDKEAVGGSRLCFLSVLDVRQEAQDLEEKVDDAVGEKSAGQEPAPGCPADGMERTRDRATHTRGPSRPCGVG